MITKIIILFFIILFILFIFRLFQKKSHTKNIKIIKRSKTDGIVDLEKDPETDEYKPKE